MSYWGRPFGGRLKDKETRPKMSPILAQALLWAMTHGSPGLTSRKFPLAKDGLAMAHGGTSITAGYGL